MAEEKKKNVYFVQFADMTAILGMFHEGHATGVVDLKDVILLQFIQTSQGTQVTVFPLQFLSDIISIPITGSLIKYYGIANKAGIEVYEKQMAVIRAKQSNIITNVATPIVDKVTKKR